MRGETRPPAHADQLGVLSNRSVRSPVAVHTAQLHSPGANQIRLYVLFRVIFQADLKVGLSQAGEEETKFSLSEDFGKALRNQTTQIFKQSYLNLFTGTRCACSLCTCMHTS
jgi:hypothetical protein